MDATPAGVLNEFLHRMASVHGDSDDAERAFELLAPVSRDNLAERAARATAVVGRLVAPYEVLAPSHFTLGFQPESLSSVVNENWATVTVLGASPGERAEVRCERVGDRWRVVLELPELLPIERRPAPAAPAVEQPSLWDD